MTWETQKRWRLLIPGVLILLSGFPLLLKSFDTANVQSFLTIENFPLTLSVIGLGALYYIFDLRGFVMGKFAKNTDAKIHDKLLSILEDDISLKQANRLYEDETVKHIFYNIVDDDSNLSNKAQRIRFNGLIWSSFTDACIISFLFSGVYLASYNFFNPQPHFIDFAFWFWFVSMSCLPLISRIVKKHLKLQDDQLNALLTNDREALTSKLSEHIS